MSVLADEQGRRLGVSRLAAALRLDEGDCMVFHDLRVLHGRTAFEAKVTYLDMAMTLSELPRAHPGYAHALESYRQLMAALLPLQTRDGLWRNVLDHPGAYAEFSATAMIGFAMQHGLQNGWIKGPAYRQAVERAWVAINSRTSSAGSFVDVCESTARMTSLEQYLQRAAILGTDARGGAMAMLFATELMSGHSVP